MPRLQPTISWQALRTICEKWTWQDPVTRVTVTGFNPPKAARKTARQKPFYIKYITLRGVPEEGECICLKVMLRTHQRMVKFIASNQIRIINDILVREVEGIRVIAG